MESTAGETDHPTQNRGKYEQRHVTGKGDDHSPPSLPPMDPATDPIRLVFNTIADRTGGKLTSALAWRQFVDLLVDRLRVPRANLEQSPLRQERPR